MIDVATYVLLAYVLTYLALTAHEMGHFIVEKIYGVEVLAVRIGRGPIFTQTIGSVFFQFGAVPYDGETEISVYKSMFNARQFIHIFLAGVVAETLCLAALASALFVNGFDAKCVFVTVWILAYRVTNFFAGWTSPGTDVFYLRKLFMNGEYPFTKREDNSQLSFSFRNRLTFQNEGAASNAYARGISPRN